MSGPSTITPSICPRMRPARDREAKLSPLRLCAQIEAAATSQRMDKASRTMAGVEDAQRLGR